MPRTRQGAVQRERWDRIAELYLDALRIPAAGRPGFLREACGGDESLSREVDSLLAQGDSTFLETPALQAAARLMDVGEVSLAGARLGPYEIISLVGAGGMGEVYRARDTRLERVVAVKVLPTGDTVSPVALQRFRREARTASALNHPNICRDLRRRRQSPLHRDGAARRRAPRPTAASWPSRSRRHRRYQHRRSRCTRRRAPDRDRPPRHQAGEHLHDPARSRRSWTSAWPRCRPAALTTTRAIAWMVVRRDSRIRTTQSEPCRTCLRSR